MLDYRSVEASSFFRAYFAFWRSGGIWLWCPNFLQALCTACSTRQVSTAEIIWMSLFSWVKPARCSCPCRKWHLSLFTYLRDGVTTTNATSPEGQPTTLPTAVCFSDGSCIGNRRKTSLNFFVSTLVLSLLLSLFSSVSHIGVTQHG